MSSSQLTFIFLRGLGIPPTRLFWARNLLYWLDSQLMAFQVKATNPRVFLVKKSGSPTWVAPTKDWFWRTQTWPDLKRKFVFQSPVSEFYNQFLFHLLDPSTCQSCGKYCGDNSISVGWQFSALDRFNTPTIRLHLHSYGPYGSTPTRYTIVAIVSIVWE
jgi:hypothetical protein